MVRARLDSRWYLSSKKVSAAELKCLSIGPEDFHGDWITSAHDRSYEHARLAHSAVLSGLAFQWLRGRCRPPPTSRRLRVARR